MHRDRFTFNHYLGAGFGPRSATVFETTATFGKAPGVSHTTPRSEDKEEVSATYAYWGKNNDEPQKIIEETYKVGVATSGLAWKIKAHYGNGLRVFEEIFEEGNYVLRPIDYKTERPDIHEFFKRSFIGRYYKEAITDFTWFFNHFPEMVVTRDFSKIYSIRNLEAAFCRWGLVKKEDEKQFINICGYTSKWPNSPLEEIEDIQVISPWWTPEEARAYLKANNIYKFIYPTYNPTPGKTYYQQAYWDAVRQAGWLDVASSIPTFKKALMENQISIKYHVKIPKKYWDQKFPDSEYTKEEKQDAIETVLQDMDDFLAGAKNAKKTFYSQFATDPITGKPLPGWEIEAVTADDEGGEYLHDASAANDEILFALGIDPTLIGHGAPGAKMGAGSGSDKYRAYSIYIALLSYDRDIVTSPLHFIRDYNGWGDNIVFAPQNIELTTLAKDQTGQQESEPNPDGTV